MRDSSLRRVSRAAVASACTYSDFTSSCYQPNENKSFHQAKEPREVGNFFFISLPSSFRMQLVMYKSDSVFRSEKDKWNRKKFYILFHSLAAVYKRSVAVDGGKCESKHVVHTIHLESELGDDNVA